LTLDDFTEDLKAIVDITDGEGSNPPAANSSYMSELQLESLLRLLAQSYIPGEPTNFSARLPDTDMTCTFSNFKVVNSYSQLGFRTR
jgi:hypothetical protein